MGQPAAVLQPTLAPTPKPPFLLTRLLPALLTAGLMYLSFFPVNWGWLAWVALVPLLWLTVQPDPRRVKLGAWLGGLVFCIAATQWIRLANDVMYAGWILLALLVSAAFPIFVWLTRVLTIRLGVPLVLAAPTAWVAAEFVRAKINVGFPWYYLGHTQHDFLAVVQIADLFCAYGVSFLVAMVNVAIFELARWGYAWARAGRQPPAPNSTIPGATHQGAYATGSMLVAVTITAISVASALGYGSWRLNAEAFAVGPKLALIQGNLPQSIRNEEGELERTARHYRDLADLAGKTEPDMIVWSETSWPYRYDQVSPELSLAAVDAQRREQAAITTEMLRDMGRHWRRPMLVGLNAVVLEPDGEKNYNSAVFIDAEGRFVDRYDKIERVPFGEFIPWEKYLPILKWLSPYDEAGDYGIAEGHGPTVFEFLGWRFGVLICYEDSIPHHAPRFMRQKTPPDFFLNISNDGWFHGSEQHEQHLVAARFRAIECRRAVARAVNMGISCIVDGSGRIHALPGKTWAESKGRSDEKACPPKLQKGVVITGTIPIDDRTSLYVAWGDVLPWACWVTCTVAVLIALIRRKKHCKLPVAH